MTQGKRKGKWTLFLALATVGVGAVLFYLFAERDEKTANYRFAPVERGSIISTVSSTGTLNAVITVQVGSQVSGQIIELFADFNSEVSKGQVIARIDPENFEARVRQAEAELAVARSNVAMQRAALERAKAELQNSRAALDATKAKTEEARVGVADAKRDLDRKKALHKNKIIAESEIDKVRATYDQAVAKLNAAEAQEQAQGSIVRSRKAMLKMAEAQVKHALAQVKQREAALSQSSVDLEHTVIRSPVDGVVIERSVDMGQTVAASLQAPTLFTIAQDLRKMQVDTNVDEADIGRIQVGQRAVFTVDAFRDREFTGKIDQIRKAPETVQNVVTYTVVVSADNSELTLLPGMTANVQIIVEERSAVLKVPNAALRFRPAGIEAGGTKGLGGGEEGGEGGSRRVQSEERIKRITEALQLNQEQQNRLRGMFMEARERIVSMRRQGASREDIRLEIERIKEKNRSAMTQMLTPEQRVKFHQLQKGGSANPRARNRVWIMGDDGRPAPLDIITGASDGTFTEVIRGDLQAGQQVIIGTDGAEGKSSRKSQRRFGF